jgi:hypothetical protein
MKATAGLFDLLFGCWHKNLSFPQSAKRGQRRGCAALPTGTYVVCLGCGKEFAYDWQTMRTLPRGQENRQALHNQQAESNAWR